MRVGTQWSAKNVEEQSLVTENIALYSKADDYYEIRRERFTKLYLSAKQSATQRTKISTASQLLEKHLPYRI